ncbi:hypothetical protein [Paracidovorax cattleyae]|uniref:Cytochrome c domain-containing protein n=1 Tax=Paracidovorax cattleyae TaxID=80868 RepID=A0A1H0WRF8_9BURK|nr:hypothetical protein [Paracidovorax cattleyae]SDP93290.1 hypothetical protein SAMN04489708_1507 [Paracidovorax cattleyae]
MNVSRSALILLAGIGMAVGPVASQPAVPAGNVGFASSLLDRPDKWSGDLFKASYAFPTNSSDMSAQPWLTLDPRKPQEREAYYAAVLAYGLTAFTGDISDGCKEVANGWYHAPWMTLSFGNGPDDVAKGNIGAGREPICGLTQERPAPKGYLHASQTRDDVQSWAVGMFNQPGGHVLGRIWRNRSVADLSDMRYPEGTFIIKFLFTEASEAEVPYLKGAPMWSANIYTSFGAASRETKPMRLLQVDFAIRDKRMDAQTGWVFGTFMYANVDASTSPHWTKNLLPVGVMWGNDPGETMPAAFKEQALDPQITKLRDQGLLFDLKRRREFGWKDRVNGPIDNPASSCLSCHGTGQVHKQENIKQFITPSARPATDANKMLWFRNIKAGDPFVFTQDELKVLDQRAPSDVRADWTLGRMADFVSTDYSLQVRMGIETSRAYANQQAIAAVNQLKLQAPKTFAKKLTGLDELSAGYKRESRRVERAGTKVSP